MKHEKDSMFGAEPDRLRQLIRSGMDVDEADVEDGRPIDMRVDGLMERPGTRIGHYKLLRVLGEGGMGMVYLAEQDQLIRRRVALKIIKPGMDSQRVLARFEAERQALALLDHPNIAQVYDAGTAESGRPYFVMEYVKGSSITAFCDHHTLSIEERLRLFQKVCAAVQHAHDKGIIHRDLKPSNILVLSEQDKAIPKVIDFGVAKAIGQPLTERTLITEDSQLLGTPEYMSPEQVELTHDDIDTRSDVYSLGVLLYEFLSGVLPFDPRELREGGIEHVRRTIRETDPKTPSMHLMKLGDEARKVAEMRSTRPLALTRLLRHELEWIPLKAMRKERCERYRSVSELADDIENYLNGAPLLAGPPTTWYRMKKFARRHRTRMMLTVIMAALLACIAAVSIMYSRAESLRHKDILSRAMEWRSRGEFQKALDAVKTVIHSKHVGAEARLLRTRLSLGLYEHTSNAVGKEDLVHALGELQTLLNAPDEIACQAHFLLAQIYLESHSNDPDTERTYQQKAKEHQQEGEKLFPRKGTAYFNRAMMAGSINQTLQCLNQAILLSPADPELYSFLKARALAYYALRDYRRMERDAVALKTLRNWDPMGHSLLAIALRETGNLSEALGFHDQAIGLSPADPDLYDQRRRTHMQMEHYEQALADARACVRLLPDEYRYRFHLFCALVNLGRYEEAKAEYAAMIQSGQIGQISLDLWAGKYVSDRLDVGLAWHPSDKEPQGTAFAAMHMATKIHAHLSQKARQVVPDGVHPAWSPDGNELAYCREILGSQAIEIIHLKSGKTRLLTVPGHAPQWSPDGQMIVYAKPRQRFSVADLTVATQRTTAPPEGRELWLIKADGSEEPRFLASGCSPSWSWDSQRVFFHAPMDETLYSIAIEGPAEPEFVVQCRYSNPKMSPDNRLLASVGGRQFQVKDLFSQSLLLNHRDRTGWWRFLSWAPDANTITLSALPGAFIGLWRHDIASGETTKVLSGPIGRTCWSPDGKQLAFTLGAPLNEIWIAETDLLGPGKTLKEHFQEMLVLYAHLVEADLQDDDRFPTYNHGTQAYSRALGIELYRAGEYNQAIVRLNRAKALRMRQGSKPGLSRLDLAFLAMSHFQLQQKQEAEQRLAELRDLYESEDYAFGQKHLYEAEQLFADQDSQIRQIWENIKDGQLDAARHILDELSTLPSNDETGRRARLNAVVKALSRAYYHRGRGAKPRANGVAAAISDYQAALRIDPDYARAYADLAWLQAACPQNDMRDPATAMQNATRACELSQWKDHVYLSTLAAVCAEAGDFAGAVQWQTEALKWVPVEEPSQWRSDYDWRLSRYQSRMGYDKGDLWSISTGRMMGCWTFDRTDARLAADSSGNGFTGTLLGDAHIVSDALRGAVLHLDGDGDCVEIADESRFDFVRGLTVSAWINSAVVTTPWASIVTKGPNAWRLSTLQEQRRFVFSMGPEGWPDFRIYGTTEVNPHEWHHLCGTYDGASMRLFVDGVEDPRSPAANSAGAFTNNAPVYIGGQWKQPGREWHGLIDKVCIYSYALSEKEVKALYRDEDF